MLAYVITPSRTECDNEDTIYDVDVAITLVYIIGYVIIIWSAVTDEKGPTSVDWITFDTSVQRDSTGLHTQCSLMGYMSLGGFLR